MSDIEGAQTTSTTPAAPPAAARSYFAHLPRLLPVGSLGLGLASAVWMSRKPERAPLIIGAAVLGWVVITVAVVVLRKFATHKDTSTRARLMRWFALAVSQTVVLQALVFPIPFFARALWPPLPQHVPFVVVYVTALVVGWWDPWYERVAARPAALVGLQAFAGFVGCLTVLPILGFTNASTFTAAGVVVALGAPVGFWLSGRELRRKSSAAVAVVVLAVLVFFAAPLVPPVPLSLESAALCTSVVHREPVGVASRFVAPAELYCHTAIGAPLGLHDKLAHVWSRDGDVVQTVALDVSGGARAEGFRTWSRLANPAAGKITCRTQTALGQVVGVVSAVVVGP